MPKEEWGTKRLCPQCNTRFYDLQRDPMTCPSCAAEFTADSIANNRTRTLIAEKTAARGTDEDVIDEDMDDAAESNDLDDDLLDEDDDSEVSLDEIADVAEGEEE